MPDTKTLPPPEPVATAPTAAPAELPPPQDVPVAPTSALPPPAPVSGALPAPVDASTVPNTAADTGVLSRLKAVFDNPRSFFNPKNLLSTQNDNTFTQTDATPGTPAYAAHQKALRDRQSGVTTSPMDRPLITFEGAMTPEEAKAHPEEYGLYQMLTGFTSPSAIAMAIGTEGFGALSGTALKILPALVSAGFSYQQIGDAIEKVPKIKSALNRGDSFEAKRLITQAAAEGLLGIVAGYHGIKGTLTSAHEALSSPAVNDTSKAMQHADYDKATRDFIAKRQVASGQQNQVAQLGLKSTPDQLAREHYTEFEEAGRDIKELAKRHKETLAGPTPAEALDAAQGKTLSLDEQMRAKQAAAIQGQPTPEPAPKVDVDHIGTRDTLNSVKLSENNNDIAHAAFIHNGDTASIGSTWVADAMRGKGYGQQLLLEAAKVAKVQGAKTFTSDPNGEMTPDAVRPWEALEKKGVPVKRTTIAGKPGFEIDLSKIDAPTSQKPPALRPGVKDDPDMRAAVEGAGGVYRGQNKDGMVEITLPRWQTEKLNIPDRMKDYVSVTLDSKDATPESIKAAMDAKFKAMGGVPEARPEVFTSPAVQDKQGLFSPEAQAAAAVPANGPAETFTTPAAQQTLDLHNALEDAKKAAAAHVVTPEERAKMAAQQDPNRSISDATLKAGKFVRSKLTELGKELQKRGLLPQGQLRENFVPHNWGFDDDSNYLRQRIYDTYHAGQQAGLVAPNKDFFANSADYINRARKQLANHDYIQDLKNGRTADGRPLAVPGGYIEGQKVSAEGPQSYVIGEPEMKRLMQKGQLTDLIRDGYVVKNADGTFTMKADDFVKTGLYETRPIGPTPIPPRVLEEMKASGTLKALEDKGLVYQNADGDYFNKENLYARVPVYAHPDIAEHLNKAVVPAKIESAPALNFYDKVTGNAKSLLLAWSPFHKVTEGLRMAESMGFTPSAKTYFFAKPVDYFDLKPEQLSAIRDGIVAANPTGASKSHVEEGLGAESGSLAAKSYKLFNTALEKAHVPDAIRKYIDPQKILNDNVFGPDGTITHAKFALYDRLKPELVEAMKADHPDWSADKVDQEAGRKAAQFANNKFGGFNNILAGRGLATQKFLRRVLLAPDFLETTGRSVLDLFDPYGAPMVRNLLKFQLTAGLTAAAINYAYHHDDTKPQTPESVLEASHILDHPFEVVSPNGKTVYGVRTTANDFLHMIKDPRTFGYDRLSPMVRSAYEIMTQRNAYGRKESLPEALKSIPKATLPIWMQAMIPGLANIGLSEPTKTDQILKAVGIGGRPERSQAEQFALGKVSEHLQGQEALHGQALVRQQLKLRAEDSLRDAYQIQDPEQKKQAVQQALAAINNLRIRNIINEEEKKKVLTDSKSTRLVSIFNSLTPDDALTTWDKATDKEKSQLGVAMHAKFVRWIEHLQKDGGSLGSLNDDQRDTLNRFRAASSEWEAIKNAPKPLPAPAASQATADKTGKPAGKLELPPPVPVNPALPPPGLAPPEAPAVYKSGDYTPIIDRAAERYGLDPGLIQAMMKQESGGNPNAKSNKGARGLMQILDSTARTYGVKDPTDPEQNIDAGAHYMSDLLKRYNGDEQKALAAYNAGPDAVDKYNGVPPYKETKNYVESIQKNKPLPRNFTPTKADVADFEDWKKTGPENIPGLVTHGNIDLSKRPLVRHSDGSVSTLYSYSFGTEDGEVLIPGVSPEGKMLTEKQAEKLYEETGQHLGIFKSPESADAYANLLHEKQGAFQTYKNGGKFNPTVTIYDNWKPKKE